MAHAAEVYAREAHLGDEAILYAQGIKFSAERKLGEMLLETERAGPQHSKGGGSKGSKRKPLPDAPPILSSLRISKKQCSEAQILAEMPEPTFKATTF